MHCHNDGSRYLRIEIWRLRTSVQPRPARTHADRCVIRLYVCTTILPHQQPPVLLPFRRSLARLTRRLPQSELTLRLPLRTPGRDPWWILVA